MGALANIFETLLRYTPPIIEASAPATPRHALVEGEPEQPIVFAEVVAASAFLDFGGVPDGRWFHALYAWRLSEAGGCVGDVPPVHRGWMPRSSLWRDSCENNIVGKGVTGRKNGLLSSRIKA